MANRQTISFIKRRLSEAGIYPVSRYGQNFLTDLNLVRMIADSAKLGPQDVALEIGTGTGSLTAMIAEKAGHVITVEIDKNLHQLAREELASFNNITFLQQDALRNKNNFSQELLDTIATAMAQIDNAQLKLVANLPYNIATPIISNLLTHEEFVPTSMTATIQKELGERIVARPATSDFGSLSLWIQAQCDAEIVRIMNPSVFWPRPKVHSAIVHIVTNLEKRARIKNLKNYQQFIRSVFIHRRKYLRSVLITVFKNQLTRQDVDETLESMGLKGEYRAEQLAVAVMIELCERLYERVAAVEQESDAQ
jgi:16S rRNA (adenine1518-N6/adenine1519-N6)-dimethyltransferase